MKYSPAIKVQLELAAPIACPLVSFVCFCVLCLLSFSFFLSVFLSLSFYYQCVVLRL